MMQIDCVQRVTWTGGVGSLYREAGPVPFLVRRRVHAIRSPSVLFLLVKTKQECKDTFCNFLPIGNGQCFFACFALYLCMYDHNFPLVIYRVVYRVSCRVYLARWRTCFLPQALVAMHPLLHGSWMHWCLDIYKWHRFSTQGGAGASPPPAPGWAILFAFSPFCLRHAFCPPSIDSFSSTCGRGMPLDWDENLPRSFGSVRGKHPRWNPGSPIPPSTWYEVASENLSPSSALHHCDEVNRQSSTRKRRRRRARARTRGAWRPVPWFVPERSAAGTVGSLGCMVCELDEEGLLTRHRKRTLRHRKDCQTWSVSTTIWRSDILRSYLHLHPRYVKGVELSAVLRATTKARTDTCWRSTPVLRQNTRY